MVLWNYGTSESLSPRFTYEMQKKAEAGEKAARKELFTRLYTHLKTVAAVRLRHVRASHTLQPTALVNEAYLKLIDQTKVKWNDRRHFLCIAGQAMRQILVDYEKQRKAKKHGGDCVRVPLNEGLVSAKAANSDIVALDGALTTLAALDKRKAQVVQLRFFSGLTIKETAEFLGVSPKTVEADWYFARAWLSHQLTKDMG